MEEDIEIIKRANEYAYKVSPKSKREIKQLVGAYIVGSEDMRRQMVELIQKQVESIHTDNSDVISNMQAEIRHLESLVETQKAIIDYKENQLSVLTEQLDAAHIFCEGVKEHYINKACKWLHEHIIDHVEHSDFDGWDVDHDALEDDFIAAMKGE